jgi:hemoglobin/transferrin/lactoferrin receptor protein
LEQAASAGSRVLRKAGRSEASASRALRAPAVGALHVAQAQPAPHADGLDAPDGRAEHELTEVRVEAVRVEAARDSAVTFDPAQSTTVVGLEQLEARQPESIFEAVRDVPGVSVNGGPRASGMSFNIRGYSDTEDVRIRLDGVTKQFEKYRFGGTFIDPEMLKQIEVRRGPQIASGSGALGGTVLATTKDAADLLVPGRRAGASAKLSYATNNQEWLGSVSVYGRPTVDSDLLVNLLTRESNDYELPDGRTYPFSSVNTDSGLLKGSLFLRYDLRVSASLIGFNDTGLQPYDATTGAPGVGGSVIRTVRDRTVSTTVNYEPGGRWINLRGTLGYGRTYLHDAHVPGLSTLTPGVGPFDDYYDFDQWNLDLANNSALGEVGRLATFHLLTGIQYEHNRRNVSRITQDARFNAPGSRFYPDGFNASQPPGTRRNAGVYIQPRADFGRAGLTAGLRWDRYEVEAAGRTVTELQTYGQASSVSYTQLTPSFGASLQLVPQRLILFYNYVQGFRPPLIDEAFSQFKPASNNLAIVGRCNPLTLGSLAPPSGVCGDRYQPEESVTREIGLTLSQPDFLAPRGRFDAKVTYFSNYTDQLLESLSVVAPGTIGQPGWEKRRGVEVEGVADTGRVLARASYARIDGTTYTCPSLYCLPTVPRGGLAVYSLYDVPGDTISLTLGARFLSGRLELAYNLLDVGARDVIKSGMTVGQPASIVRQDGYTLHNASLRFAINPQVELRVSGENLGNETYYYYSGSYQGAQAPGRNVRFTLSVRM